MKKSFTIISTLLIISLLAGAAFAWGPGKGRRSGNGDTNACYNCPGQTGQAGTSDLTKEQTDQLTVLRQKLIDNTYAEKSAKMAKTQEIRLLMQTSNPDRAKLSQLSNDVLELDKQIMDKQIDHQLEVKKIAPQLSGFRGMGFGKGPGMKSSKRGQGRSQRCGGSGNF